MATVHPKDITLPKDEDLGYLLEKFTISGDERLKEEKIEKPKLCFTDLPLEIVNKIALHLEQEDRWPLARTNKRYYQFLRKLLFETIFVGYCTDELYFDRASMKFNDIGAMCKCNTPCMIDMETDFIKKIEVGKNIKHLVIGVEYGEQKASDDLITPILELLAHTPNLSSATVRGMWNDSLHFNIIYGLSRSCPSLTSLDIEWTWHNQPSNPDIDLTYFPYPLRLKHLRLHFFTGLFYPIDQEKSLSAVVEKIMTLCMGTLEQIDVSLAGQDWAEVAGLDFDNFPGSSKVKSFSYAFQPGLSLSLGNMMLIDLENLGRKFPNLEELAIFLPFRKLPVVMQEVLVPVLQQLRHCKNLCLDFNTSGDLSYYVGTYGHFIHDEIFNGNRRRKVIIQLLAKSMPELRFIEWPHEHSCFRTETVAKIQRKP